jgi:hypothetical protein
MRRDADGCAGGELTAFETVDSRDMLGGLLGGQTWDGVLGGE